MDKTKKNHVDWASRQNMESNIVKQKNPHMDLRL